MAQDTLTPELQLERDRLLRRRRITESMLAQSQQPLGQPGPGIALSPFQGLAQLAQAYVGKNQLQANDKALENIGTRYNEGLAKAVKDYTASGAVPIDPQEVEQNADQGAPLPRPDPRARVAQAMTSPYAPVRQMAVLDFQTEEKRQDRAEQRAQRMQELELRLADSRLQAQERAELQRQLQQMRNDAQRDIQNLIQSNRPAPADQIIQTENGIYRMGRDGKPVQLMGQDGRPLMPKPAGKTGKPAEVEATLNVYVAARNGLLTGLSGSETGPVAGRLPAVTSGAQTAEGGVSAMAPVLKQIFRVAGEGTFTDKDQQLLLEMVPTRKDTPAAREAKIRNIDNIISAKLGLPVPSFGGDVPGGDVPPPPAGFQLNAP